MEAYVGQQFVGIDLVALAGRIGYELVDRARLGDRLHAMGITPDWWVGVSIPAGIYVRSGLVGAVGAGRHGDRNSE